MIIKINFCKLDKYLILIWGVCRWKQNMRIGKPPPMTRIIKIFRGLNKKKTNLIKAY